MESTGCMIGKRPCFIIPLPTIMGYWNVSLVFLTVDSMICNSNIYSRSTERSNNNLPPLSPFLCHSRAPLLFLSD